MNINRRALLQSGVAVSTASLVPDLVAASVSDRRLSPEHGALGQGALERFIVDVRFTDAIDAGRAARARGIEISEVTGDMTRLWYGDLNLRWKDGPMTLAGVTAEDSLFVLGTLAPDFRMRVVQREALGPAPMLQHGRAGSLPLYAWLIAPAN